MGGKEKKNIVCIFPNKLGGVAILMKNLVDYFPSSEYKFFIIFTKIKEEDYTFCDELFKNTEHRKFTFSKYENRYYIHKRLTKLIPQNTDIIIANDWIELETYSTKQLKQKLIFILHGDYDYYYDLAIKHSKSIDCFISVSQVISLKLKKKLPKREKDIKYLKNIIANPSHQIEIKVKKNYNAIFVGRLTEAKGFFDLEKIDNLLNSRDIVIDWTIIGSKKEKIDENNSWLSKQNVNWLGALDNISVLKEYHKNDFFILPTRAEGLGMVIIEAMKSGCIPLVSKLEAGIPEFVIDNKTGYMIEIGNIQKYAEIIEKLTKSLDKRRELSENAIKKANFLFNPNKDAKEYYSLFEYLLELKRKQKKYPETKLSRLDKKYLPNFFVKIIRSILKNKRIQT